MLFAHKDCGSLKVRPFIHAFLRFFSRRHHLALVFLLIISFLLMGSIFSNWPDDRLTYDGNLRLVGRAVSWTSERHSLSPQSSLDRYMVTDPTSTQEFPCGNGTHLSGNQCVADISQCGSGTHLSGNHCVANVDHTQANNAARQNNLTVAIYAVAILLIVGGLLLVVKDGYAFIKAYKNVSATRQ
ncbi:hypothetical protein [Tengunoibacter tsumagoiensis]|uniref:hypothetical protein n=1 Tax=Tengunoibacter tsumagoiensis TaxID=2014871 RepID=UPI000F824064|nr:hypothetical protein [Tengunoibacter tsumagoiensis]